MVSYRRGPAGPFLLCCAWRAAPCPVPRAVVVQANVVYYGPMRKYNYTFLFCFLAVMVAAFLFNLGSTSVVDPKTFQPAVYASAWALLPPILAIGLALITKEVYSSLFTGILVGAILYADGNLLLMLNTLLFADDAGLIAKISKNWNVGIIFFLVILGILVALMNRTGASAAFGQWSMKNIKSRIGAQIATVVLGLLIFVDDYFNCLTVGSVMRPVTDKFKVSRAKLAYLIDATAAPICIIAPISSWAAAVTSSVPKDADINGFAMFLSTIPYNLYAFCTIFMMVFLVTRQFDYGPMKTHEENAAAGDLLSLKGQVKHTTEDDTDARNGKVIDLLFPVFMLIVCCVLGMVYTGGWFDGTSFIDAFADADASKGLVLGSSVTMLVTFVFYMTRNVISFQEFSDCIPEGFKAMVAPIMILALAWTLSGMTGLLGAKFYIRDIVQNSAGALQMFLPAVVFLISIFLAFSTGTSWGTFAILIPIVCTVYGDGANQQMLTISIAACLSGAVCGDHCSPISDTTIMASAGAQSDHVNHVTTQLPYVLTAAAVSAVGFVLAGWLGYMFSSAMALLSLPITLVLMGLTLMCIKKRG